MFVPRNGGKSLVSLKFPCYMFVMSYVLSVVLIRMSNVLCLFVQCIRKSVERQETTSSADILSVLYVFMLLNCVLSFMFNVYLFKSSSTFMFLPAKHGTYLTFVFFLSYPGSKLQSVNASLRVQTVQELIFTRLINARFGLR